MPRLRADQLHETDLDETTAFSDMPPPAPELTPRDALRLALEHVVACVRACYDDPEHDAACVEAGMLLSDGHYAAGWQRLGAAMERMLAVPGE